ncbi:MAG: 4Fe-4S dicluster domain-containing protein [Desulfotignum sp.]|nr:4Fe-4S dicluster domain-containing protein [Desulfotignum sp.]
MDLTGGYNPGRARLEIQRHRENLYHLPIVCNQCENAYCMTVCPAGAISRTEAGIVCIDPQKCVGCGLCTEYCPIGMVALDPDTRKAVKCELCGGNPKCVAACPTGALELVTLEEVPDERLD